MNNNTSTISHIIPAVKPTTTSNLNHNSSLVWFHRKLEVPYCSLQNLKLNCPIQSKGLAGKTFCSVGICTHSLSDAESHSHVEEERVGVLLLNLGGPDTLCDADALKSELEAKKVSANVYVAMRYWHPFTEEAAHQIKKDGIMRLVVLPLYPQFSISTTGSSIRALHDIFWKDNVLSKLPVAIIKSWYRRDGYIKSMADLIEKELQSFDTPQEVMIFFSAHGVPVTYVVNAGDPYKDQMEQCIYLIMQELKARGIDNKHRLAYQSRVGPVQWLKPYTDEVLVELGQEGVKSLLAVPVSFVSEHIETLEEIDMEYKELALKSGVENWGRVPALGCTSSFITDLADAVIEALPSATPMSTLATPSSAQQFRHNPIGYAIKIFFGSFFTLLLLLSPRMLSAFRKPVV